MARAEVIGFDNLELTLKAMANCEKDCLRAVQEATPVVEQAMKQATASAVKYGTGALVASLQATPAKKNRWGHFSVVRPVGVDKDGKRLGEIFAYMEYGVPSRGIHAHNIRAQAKHMAEARVQAIFERTLKEAFDK